MKIKTAELTGPALDWAVYEVLKRDGRTDVYMRWFGDGRPDAPWSNGPFRPSTDWSQGGPIIERELLAPEPELDCNCECIGWCCRNWIGNGDYLYGPTPLIAAMRCYCCSKLGEFVDIPEELCQQ